MKNLNNNLMGVAVVSLALGLVLPMAALAASPATVNLGTAGNFVILAKTGVSTTGATSVVGDIGVSPAAATFITGFALTLPAASAFSTSALVTGKVYAPGYADPTPFNLTTAVLDMQTAYTSAAGRASDVTELGAGNIGGLTLASGVYKWGTGVTIPTDVTLSGGAQDVWIFQIAQNLTVSSSAKIVLAGGAQSSNIFWVVAGQTTIGTTAVFNGNILDQTAIVLNTGAKLNGRALAQTAVTLDGNTVTAPTSAAATPATPAVPATPASGTSNPAASATPAVPATPSSNNQSICDYPAPPQGCSYVQNSNYNSNTKCGMVLICPAPAPTSSGQSDAQVALQVKLDGLVATAQSLQAKIQARQQSFSAPAPVSAFGQQVRMIAVNLGRGSNGNDVTTLQQFLISQGKGPAAQALARAGATAHFGVLTRAALAEFQAKAGIPALGNFGERTRAYISANY